MPKIGKVYHVSQPFKHTHYLEAILFSKSNSTLI